MQAPEAGAGADARAPAVEAADAVAVVALGVADASPAPPAQPRVRLLTPAGQGALAALEVTGVGAGDLLARALDRPPPKSGCHALRWVRSRGAAADQVVCAAIAADRFEITGHAGPAVVRRVLAALVEAGAAPHGPGVAATPTAFESARTVLAARVLQWVERGLVDPAREPARTVVARLTEPARVVLTGPPNAGKSTLLNALLERERAIASPLPGTTRDALEEDAAFFGVPVLLVDTAGIGDAPRDDLERAGMRRARSSARAATIRVLVVDAAAPLPKAAAAALAALRPADLVVLQKADLEPAVLRPGADGVPTHALPVSARTGAGLDALRLALAKAALGYDPRALTHPQALAGAGCPS